MCNIKLLMEKQAIKVLNENQETHLAIFHKSDYKDKIMNSDKTIKDVIGLTYRDFKQLKHREIILFDNGTMTFDDDRSIVFHKLTDAVSKYYLVIVDYF